MKTSVMLAFFAVVVLAVSYANADECTTGDVKEVECNTCRCLNGYWACTKVGCLRKREIPARFDVESRVKRDNHVAEDLKDTPCAPNDYFHIDCNVCYCNLERTGYLCTQNNCYNTHQSSTSRAPLDENSVPAGSRDEVGVVENATSVEQRPGGLNRDETTSTEAESRWDQITPLGLSNRSDVSEDRSD